MKEETKEGFIPPHGGYHNLLTYQKAEIIYDATVHFTKTFLDKYDRTVDQMVQAARSGKQNIREASMASGTSKETEIKLTNVARASLDELLADYEDFLRTRKLPIWDRKHRLALRFDELNKTPNANYQTYVKALENPKAEISANSLICLTKITIWLLNRQLKALEKAFLKDGGLKQRMTKARVSSRGKNQ
jgi:four helix bundle suffix protein